jgi:hypothetical protein
MGFEHEESLTTTADPAAVWRLWSDVGSWHRWDPAVEGVALEGHFAEGAAGTMVLAGGVEVPFTLEVVEPGARYLDRLTIGDLSVRVDHTVRPRAATDGDADDAADGGADITVRTTVEGPGAAEVGAMVTADAPRALAALTALAEGSGG